ncbi:MAG: hypothetical protein AAGG51_30535 [Cyanobacteria bacterium P01_G01_bin.54]
MHLFKYQACNNETTTHDGSDSGAFPPPILLTSAQTHQPIFYTHPQTQNPSCEWVDRLTAQTRLLNQEYALDQKLRISRSHIPVVCLAVPPHPKQETFYYWQHQLTKPTHTLSIIPETANQRIYLRALQQTQSILATQVANHICPTLPNHWFALYCAPIPISHLSSLEKWKTSLFCKSDVLTSVYDLLQIGFPIIQSWAERHTLTMPYDTPERLFYELLENNTYTDLTDGVLRWGNVRKPSKHQQRQADRQFRAFLRYSSKDKAEEQAIHDALWQLGWSGYWLLALREWLGSAASDQNPERKHQLKAAMHRYRHALVAVNRLYLEAIFWQDQHPQRTHQTSDRSVDFRLDPFGFIYCQQLE